MIYQSIFKEEKKEVTCYWRQVNGIDNYVSLKKERAKREVLGKGNACPRRFSILKNFLRNTEKSLSFVIK